MVHSLKWFKTGIQTTIHLSGSIHLSAWWLYCAGLWKRDRPTSIEDNCYPSETYRVLALIPDGSVLGPWSSAMHAKRRKRCLISCHVPISLRTHGRSDGRMDLRTCFSGHPYTIAPSGQLPLNGPVSQFRIRQLALSMGFKQSLRTVREKVTAINCHT